MFKFSFNLHEIDYDIFLQIAFSLKTERKMVYIETI